MKKAREERELVRQYLQEFGKKPVYSDDLLSYLGAIFKGDGDTVVISQHRLFRGIARVRGIKTARLNVIREESAQFFAMRDALQLLSKKRIPVFYYNRIGLMKNGFTYSASAQKRMQKKISFPVMYENVDQYADDLRELFGEKYSKEYIEQIGKIPQVVKHGSRYCHEDSFERYIHVQNGIRITCNQPEEYSKTIYIYGRCGAFGYAVEDADTLPSQLQKRFVERGVNDIRVVNRGLWGGENKLLFADFLQDVAGMHEGDIVIFYMKHLDNAVMAEYQKCGMWYKNITREWHEYDEAKWCFFDKPGHMNRLGYNIVSELLYKDLIEKGFSCKPTENGNKSDLSASFLTQYLKSLTDDSFEKEISDFTRSILDKYPASDDIKSCGAIVMNCNPFTKGHRYLIEYAAKKVDRLYIFVVEEDKSFFKFEDRFKMVLDGTRDIDNVVVVPSGKFIISAYTFPEYFMKDYVKEKNFDVSMDIETFCRYIAPRLNIKIRFAGEEPFDPVTSNYNDSMQKILPLHGLVFEEVPRLAIDPEHIINATKVRELIDTTSIEELREYVPESTLAILRGKYFKH